MTCPHAVRHALVLPENLHCRVLIVRGCSFAHRPNGWCAAGEVSSKRCPDSASISSNALASYLQPFTHASNFCKVLLRSEEHTSELQSRLHLVCRLLLEKKKQYVTGASSSI